MFTVLLLCQVFANDLEFTSEDTKQLGEVTSISHLNFFHVTDYNFYYRTKEQGIYSRSIRISEGATCT